MSLRFPNYCEGATPKKLSERTIIKASGCVSKYGRVLKA